MRHESVISGPPFVLASSLVGVGAAIPAVCIAVDVFVPSSSRLVGRDFAGFWAAGHLAVTGHPSAAYSSHAIAETMRPLANLVFAFIYPPQTLALLAPFGLLQYYVALLLWTVAGGAAFMFVARKVVPFSPWLVVISPAALLNVWQGQFAFFFGALWLLAFSGNYRVAGVAGGLSLFKPHLAAMLAPQMISERTTIKYALLVAFLVGIFCFPLWRPFLTAVRAQAGFVANADPHSLFLRMMPGAYAAFGRSWIAQLVFAGCAVAVLAKYGKFNAFTLATATFLILPYAHNYDMTVACLGPIILLWTNWPTLARWESAVLSLGYLAPALTFVTPWLVPPILLMCLLVQCRFAVSEIAPAQPSFFRRNRARPRSTGN